LTDFGLQDAFVGVMKGVIYSIAPEARIVDLCHLVQPQNILHGAVLLADSYRYFPPDSIHLAVVDPGVGTRRAGLAARVGSHYFVAPDNGLLTAVYEQAEQRDEEIRLVHLENSRYWLPQVSRTFHGRDIFAPVAAHLATGVELELLGRQVDHPVRIPIPRPARTENGWAAQVLMSDAFGNLITNLTASELGAAPVREVRIAGVIIRKIVATFGDGQPGELIALIDSSGRLSIGLVNGSAREKLQIGAGAVVEVILNSNPQV
jgi:hypothetical protein